MSLDHRITKLEQKAGTLLLCLSCQWKAAIGLRELRSGPKNSDTVVKKCPFCGGRYEIPLKGRSKEVREIVRLILEADPIQKYYDERWHCAMQWFVRRNSQTEIYRREMTNDDPFRFYQPYPPAPRFKENTNSSSVKRNSPILNLQAKAAKFTRDESLKIKRLIKAPEWFPIDETIGQIRAQVRDQKHRHIAELHCKLKLPYLHNLPEELQYTLNACFNHLETLKEREAYEVFIWRRSLEGTKTETIFFEQEVRNKSKEAIQATTSTEIAKPATGVVTEQIPQDIRGQGSLENTQQTAPVRTDQSNVHILRSESSRAVRHDSLVADHSLIVNREYESPESPPQYRTIEDASSRSKGYERFFSNRWGRPQVQPRFMKSNPSHHQKVLQNNRWKAR